MNVEDNYVTLKKGDDWGSIYYAINPKNENGMCSSDRGVKLFEGQQVDVLWPNGLVTYETIKIIRKPESIYDHGNTYTVWSNRYYITPEVNGAKCELELDQVKVNRQWATSNGAK